MTNEYYPFLAAAYALQSPQPFKPGDICLDVNGYVGMITEEKPIDGVWHGVHLAPDKAGWEWESKRPKKVLESESVVRFAKLVAEVGV